MSYLVPLWVIFAITAGGITNAKHRGWREGLAWGSLLGIFGMIVVMFLPALSEAEAKKASRPSRPNIFMEEVR